MNGSSWIYELQERVFSLYRPISCVIVFALTLTGLWFWLSEGTPDEGSGPFILAQLSGVLGGLLLLARLISKQEERVRRDLLWISLLLVIATAAFAVEGLYSPDSFDFRSRGPDTVHRVVAHVSFFAGGLAFSLATGSLVLLIGHLREAEALASRSDSTE